MKLFILLASAVFFWLTAETAHAGPVIAAIGAAFTSFASTAIGGFIVKTLMSIGLSFASSLLQKMLMKKQQQDPVGVKLNIEMGDERPVSTTIGRYATAGKRKYAGVYGSIGGTPNAMFVDVIELGNMPVSGLDGLWIDDEKCIIMYDEETSRGFPIYEFQGAQSKDHHAWIKFYDGTQTQANAYLLSHFGDHPQRPWLETMIGRGCPFAIMTYRFNQGFFSGIPNCVFELGPLRLYDIRKDSSVGGNGSHRWNDRSTWEPSTNLVVMIYNIIRGMYYGSQWMFGGQRLAASRLPASNWIAAAQEAARLIDVTGQPREPQFRGGYEITGEMNPLDVIDDLRAGCAGRIAENGGSFKIHVGAFGAAEFGFTDADIIITEDQSFEPFPGLDDTVNAIRATYPEPDEKWASKDAPTLYDEDLEEADGNRTLPADVQFPAVPYKRQVQRLMRAMIKEERRFRVHQFYLPPQAWVLEPNDVIAWTSARNGYVNKRFIILAIEGEMTMNQLVTIKEIDPADYDWSPDFEMPTSEGWIGRIDAPAQPMTGWTVEASSILDDSGLERRPAIRVHCAADLEDVVRVHIKVRLKESGAIVFDSDQTPYGEPYAWDLAGVWLLPDTDYEVAGRYVPYTARVTNWSSWLEVRTKDLLISSIDVFDNAIIQSKIADAAISAAKIMDEAVTNLKLANEAVSTAKLQVAAVTAEVLANSAVISSKLAEGAVTAAKIAAQAIDATKFASSIEPVTIALDSQPLPTSKVTASIYWQGALYQWNGASYTKPEAEVGPGSITVTKIADGAISTPKLATNAVTADKILANAITVGKIAAGAVGVDQLAASAVIASKIAAGAISADKLAVGTGKNMIPNADFANGVTGWSMNTNGGDWGAGLTIRTDTYGVAAMGSIEALQRGAQDNGRYADIYPKNPKTNDTYRFPVKVGARYECYFHVFGHRSNGARVHIDWRDQNNNNISYAWADAPTNQNFNPQGRLSNYVRCGVFATAPANAAFAYIFVRCWGHSAANGVDSYTWVSCPLFAEATANQTEFSPWGPAGVTIIESGHIVTNAITADKIMADAVTASKIATGAVTADAIASNSVTTVKLAADSVTGAKIAANTIAAEHIAANAITAKQLVLTDFSNMADNGWQTGTLDGWAIQGRINYLYSADKGNASGWIFITNARDSARSAWVQVTPGETYFFDVWVYNYDANPAQILVGRKSSPNGSVSHASAAGTNNKNAWTRLQGQYTVEPGVYYISMLLQVDKTSGTGGQTEWSKPVMRRAYGGELIVDGAITAAKIAANAITAGMIQAGAITADKIAAGNITADKLQVGSVDVTKLAQNAAVAAYVQPDISPIDLTGNPTIFNFNVDKDGNDFLLVHADARVSVNSGSTFPVNVTMEITSGGVIIGGGRVQLLAVNDVVSLTATGIVWSGGVQNVRVNIRKDVTTSVIVGRRTCGAIRMRKATT